MPATTKRTVRRLVSGAILLALGTILSTHYRVGVAVKYRAGSATVDSNARNSPNGEFMGSGATEVPSNTESPAAAFAGIGATTVTLTHTVGDPLTCEDVIYTGYTRDPTEGSRKDVFWLDANTTTRITSEGMVNRGWEAISYLVRTSPALRSTCCVFFLISSPLTDRGGRELNPVWGRLPATALVMAKFALAEVFLYMDSDAMPTFPDKSPTMMYDELAFDGYGQEATFRHLTPGLIVNTPPYGWMCLECTKFRLGHGCFNSGALLWHRARAEPVLRAWWASRKMSMTENFRDPDVNGGHGFNGWNVPELTRRLKDHMGEQNRLMYIFATNPRVRGLVLPVPRRLNTTICTRAPKFPCLQKTFAKREEYTERVPANWNPSKPSCFISHYTKGKEAIAEHTAMMMMNNSSIELAIPTFLIRGKTKKRRMNGSSIELVNPNFPIRGKNGKSRKRRR